MIVLSEKDLPILQKTAVAVGMFDGFHAGHIELIEDIKNRNLKSAIYTFDIKPTTKELIFSHEEKQAVAEQLGVDYYFQRKFSEEFSCTMPEGFISMLKSDMNMAHLAVGFDFRFGRGAGGDTELLKQCSEKYGYSLSVLPAFAIDGEKISSSGVRALIAEGEVARAARLLTRHYFIDGKIDGGRRLAGIAGLPTANISTNKLLPAQGVYAVWVNIAGERFSAVANVREKADIGCGDMPCVETFISGYKGKLFGEQMRICFVEKIRQELEFCSRDALVSQIAEDSAVAERLLAQEVL